MITANELWGLFREKLRNNTFNDVDFHIDMRWFLSAFLTDESAKFRRDKFFNAPFTAVDGETKKIILVDCPDSEYRFDFIETASYWQLCFIECITLPVNGIVEPCNDFIPLPEQEAWIKAEREISQTVHFYCKLKELLGINEALSWFKDGAGTLLCAKSWVPFYKDSKAFIAFSAWIENRINGEHVSIDHFSDLKCQLRFTGHIWFQVYHKASHIKTQLTFDEYKMLFEYIWVDRANNAGWDVSFDYVDEDTVLTFSKM